MLFVCFFISLVSFSFFFPFFVVFCLGLFFDTSWIISSLKSTSSDAKFRLVFEKEKSFRLGLLSPLFSYYLSCCLFLSLFFFSFKISYPFFFNCFSLSKFLFLHSSRRSFFRLFDFHLSPFVRWTVIDRFFRLFLIHLTSFVLFLLFYFHYLFEKGSEINWKGFRPKLSFFFHLFLFIFFFLFFYFLCSFVCSLFFSFSV